MNQKTPTLNDDVKRQIADAMPSALERALDEYQAFADEAENAKKSKDFLSRINAKKAAIAHIELLLKLAGLVDAVDEQRADEVGKIVHDALKELEQE